MKIKNYSFEVTKLVEITLAWTFINFAANLLGLWLTKLLNEAGYTYPENVWNEFASPILVQSLFFGICLVISYNSLKNKNLSYYAFSIFQFIIFHLVFLLNLNFTHGIKFISNFSNFGLKYISYFGQYLVDILYLYFPINGNFKDGNFAPDNLITFYLHWIFMVLVYYFIITLLSVRLARYFFKK